MILFIAVWKLIMISCRTAFSFAIEKKKSIHLSCFTKVSMSYILKINISLKPDSTLETASDHWFAQKIFFIDANI